MDAKALAKRAAVQEIGFDPKCVTKTAPTGTGVQSWWLYSIDYNHVKNIGGVAQCIPPKAQPRKVVLAPWWWPWPWSKLVPCFANTL